MAKEELQGTPQYQHARKLAEAEAARKAAVKVTETWYQLVPCVSKKGAKVVKFEKTTTGIKHRTFVGFEKECVDLLAKAKKEGKLR